MKIGIFDSGVGGLSMMKALTSSLPDYDYVYLGDTARTPYGSKSHEEVYQYTKQGVEFLFSKGASLVILACNTASARALRRIQQDFLPGLYDSRRVLGVIIPAVEDVTSDVLYKYKRIGVLATKATVESHTFSSEIKKRNDLIDVVEVAAPELVPLVEAGKLDETKEHLEKYLFEMKERSVEALILGCTHYSLLEDKVQSIMGDPIDIVNEEKVIPKKLKRYLNLHQDIESQLEKNQSREFYVTKDSEEIDRLAKFWYGDDVSLSVVDIESK